MDRNIFGNPLTGVSRRTQRRRRLDQLKRANIVNSITVPGVASGTTGGIGVADTRRDPSWFWGDCPWEEMLVDGSRGCVQYDDFKDVSFAGTQTTEIIQGKYKIYNTGATKIASLSAFNSAETQDGIIALTLDTAGDAAAIGFQSCPFSLSTTAAGKLWMEARVASLSVATADGQLFVGLGENDEVTFGAATPLADADATSSGDAKIGWNRLEDGTTALNTSYADRAAAWTNVQASAATLAAVTWIKLGMVFDPKDSTRCVRFYYNGVETTTAMTKTTLAALTSLDAKGLGLVASCFADTGAATVLYIDWWKCAQMYK